MNDPAAKPSDEELVARAQKGDRRAFEELIERHKQRAYRIAFDFARDREEARDLSQDAFLKAYKSIKRFDGRSGFYTWFYRILVNVCLDYKRRRQRTPLESYEEQVEAGNPVNPQSDAVPRPEEQVMAGQVARRIGEALLALPPKQRTAFILRNHQGLSIKEIAEMMETAEGTVKVHLHRAVVTLRQTLAEFA